MRNGRVTRLSVVRALLAVSLVALAGPLGGAPSNVSVTPSSGSGSGQTFSYLFSDPNGFADIVSAQMLVGATLERVQQLLPVLRAVNEPGVAGGRRGCG